MGKGGIEMKHVEGIDSKTADKLKGIEPQYRELSDEEIKPLIKKYGIMDAYDYGDGISEDNAIEFARAILKKASA